MKLSALQLARNLSSVFNANVSEEIIKIAERQIKDNFGYDNQDFNTGVKAATAELRKFTSGIAASYIPTAARQIEETLGEK